MKTTVLILLVALSGVVTWAALGTARADVPAGLFWTTRTRGIADVQKLEDPKLGVVCYVASNPDISDAPAISCVEVCR